ncbi:hypothetical protein ABH935_009965 [Catenulispora sp. GAS73]
MHIPVGGDLFVDLREELLELRWRCSNPMTLPLAGTKAANSMVAPERT